GALRAIEFIYKEAGVNRPLKSSDNKTDNQNKTDYHNQINKVANAIKEIINALKNPPSAAQAHSIQHPVSSSKKNLIRNKAIVISIAIILSTAFG
ncbi:MAG: hypothetical protein JNL53_01330, partial [Cyclobacteriaceae bacterium]|nr:hypothetical protein [Cyclobacteriaceae bacterium]